jgi:hypothetical protein
MMAKENKNKTAQIRITSSERQMLARLKEINPHFSASRLFRGVLHKYYEKIMPKEPIEEK